MKTLQVLIVLIVLIFFSLLFGCKKENLNGHWHIHKVGVQNGFSGDYFTFDIENDTIVTFDKDLFSEYGLSGNVDQKNKQMIIGGECLVLNFRYRLLDDNLILNQIEYDEINDISFIGQKCDSLCCDLQQDFFKDALVEIDLIKDTQKEKLLPIHSIPSPLLRPIYIGKAKPQYPRLCSNQYLVSLGYYKIGIEKIETWKESSLLKLPESKRDLSRAAIFVDKNIPNDQLLKILIEIIKTEQRPVYLALRIDSEKFDAGFVILNPSMDDQMEEYLTNKLF